jgi:hypothetical protein
MDSLFLDPNQRRELGEALLHVSDMIAASRTMCLHCKRLPATKVEDDKGFTLCDACFQIAEPAAILADAQLSKAEGLAAELGRWRLCFRKAARDLLYHGPFRNLSNEQFEALGPDDLAREAEASVMRLESVCDEASEVRYLCEQMGIRTAAGGNQIPLVDLLHHILTSDVDYGNRYSLLRRAETEEGRAVEHEEYAAQCRDDAAKYRRWARGEAS